MEKTEKNQKNQRVTAIAMELYDDSCNPIWQKILHQMHAPAFAIQHNHDKKYNGESKKPHWHLLIMFDRQIRTNYASRIATELGAANGYWESVTYKTGYARYMCHMDNPEKYQYAPNDVICFGGADYINFVTTNAEKAKLKNDTLIDIIQMIRHSGIRSYAMVVNIAIDSGNDDWVNILRGNGAFIAEYIKSAYWASESDPQYKHYEYVQELKKKKLRDEQQKQQSLTVDVEEEAGGHS